MAVAFVGPLSQFFAKQPEDAARLRAGVEKWREDLRSRVADKVSAQLEWGEDRALARSWDLGESGWSALRLFAFCAERADLEFPDRVPPLLELLPEWRVAADEKFLRSLYGQLLACEVWLPGEFPVTIRAPRPDGQTAEFGSLSVLKDQLQWLNQRTFQADREVIETWLELPAPNGGEFVAAARRGYASLLLAVELACAEVVPLSLR